MDVNQLYTDIILEYNNDKTNKREIACPTISEHGHNANCGDDIKLQVVLKDGVIADIAYTGNGCAISQASTAMLIELLGGKTVEEAMRLTRLFLDMILGKVNDEGQLEELEAAAYLKNIAKMPVRVKCAVLAWHTLSIALEKELAKKK